MMNPPPTPSRPERKPTAIPDNVSDLAQRASQTRRPLKSSSWHGVAGKDGVAFAEWLPERLNILMAI